MATATTSVTTTETSPLLVADPSIAPNTPIAEQPKKVDSSKSKVQANKNNYDATNQTEKTKTPSNAFVAFFCDEDITTECCLRFCGEFIAYWAGQCEGGPNDCNCLE
ncbi:MAG: hypothetical protein ACPGUD_03160 [Parashewanella sp.]